MKKLKAVKNAVRAESKTGAVTETEMAEIRTSLGIRDVTPPPRKPAGSVKDLALEVFKAAPDKEFTANEVVLAVQVDHPSVKADTIKYTLTELRTASAIHLVRRDGHASILKFGPGRVTFLPKAAKNTAVKATTGSVPSDAAILKEASAVIAKLLALVNRNTQALEQIARLKSVL